MKMDVASNPLDLGLPHADAVVLEVNAVADAFQKPRGIGGVITPVPFR